MMKVLMSWDIRTGREAEYFEFAVKEFAPGLIRLGLQTSEVWYTLYGDCPQMLHGCVAEDLPTIQNILKTDEWHDLMAKLGEYVTDFHQKIVHATGNFQL
jgi:hypothetical protein